MRRKSHLERQQLLEEKELPPAAPEDADVVRNVLGMHDCSSDLEALEIQTKELIAGRRQGLRLGDWAERADKDRPTYVVRGKSYAVGILACRDLGDGDLTAIFARSHHLIAERDFLKRPTWYCGAAAEKPLVIATDDPGRVYFVVRWPDPAVKGGAPREMSGSAPAANRQNALRVDAITLTVSDELRQAIERAERLELRQTVERAERLTLELIQLNDSIAENIRRAAFIRRVPDPEPNVGH